MKKIDINANSFFNVLESTQRSQVAEMTLEPGKTTGGPNNKQPESDQWLYIISGSGKAVIENEKIRLEKGDLLLIEADETHEIINDGDEKLVTFNIYAPNVY